ncbi:MAG: hypothetical protein M1381_07090 [Deltaproteobacteria bacterium]|nr:hypothetical protein [Deltaproteobacteria bacterium]
MKRFISTIVTVGCILVIRSMAFAQSDGEHLTGVGFNLPGMFTAPIMLSYSQSNSLSFYPNPNTGMPTTSNTFTFPFLESLPTGIVVPTVGIKMSINQSVDIEPVFGIGTQTYTLKPDPADTANISITDIAIGAKIFYNVYHTEKVKVYGSAELVLSYGIGKTGYTTSGVGTSEYDTSMSGIAIPVGLGCEFFPFESVKHLGFNIDLMVPGIEYAGVNVHESLLSPATSPPDQTYTGFGFIVDRVFPVIGTHYYF